MIEVCAAIIYKDNKILIAKRAEHKAQGGKWEFPGGKLEEGETHEACLKRELLEEMCIEIEVRQYVMTHTHTYETGEIRLIAYKACYLGGDIQLNDHSDIRWVEVDALQSYDFAEADKPFVTYLIQGGQQSDL